jgi:23S rRNA (guanosine2251-2'-O)-methyltransferase
MEVIYGINPILEALRKEPCPLVEVSVARGGNDETLHAVLELAGARKIPVAFRDRRELDKLTGHGAHQGVAGFFRSFAYAELQQVIENRCPLFSGHLVLLLDEITDPRNLGALIRAAHCLGANGVLIPGNRAAAVTAVVIKASAGTALLTPVARVANLSRAMDDLKEQGFWIYGADARDGRPLGSVSYQGHVGLAMGAEGRGLRALIRKRCDFLLSVPMFGKVDSLNVSVAAGIILNDIVRSRAHAEGVE